MNLLNRLFKRSPADPADRLIAWLADKSLDDRRIVAGLLYGGPASLKVWQWLLSRADCDTGTAAMLLWEFGLPYALLRSPDRFPLSDAVKNELIAFIAARWREGRFAAAVFAYDPREQVKRYRRELTRHGLKGENPFRIPEEAWRPIAGRPPRGSAATAYATDNPLNALMGAVRLADLAAINPADWGPARRDTSRRT